MVSFARMVRSRIHPIRMVMFGLGFAGGAVVSSVVTLWFVRRESVHPALGELGAPAGGSTVLHYANHVLAYDSRLKNPTWVAERIDRDTMKGEANRKHSRFGPDPSLPSVSTATNADFSRSGYSRGHMAPAGDNKHSQRAMDDTFYLTNIVPQDFDNNSGYWNLIESFCRDLAKQHGSINVLSGPLYLPNVREDKKLFVKYQVIGSNQVAVPTHLYKVIVIDQPGGKSLVSAFVVPNEPIDTSTPLTKYRVPLETLEKHMGMQLFPQLSQKSVLSLCDNLDTGCELSRMKSFPYLKNQYRLRRSASVKELESVWSEATKEGMEKSLSRDYEKRREELTRGKKSRERSAASCEAKAA